MAFDALQWLCEDAKKKSPFSCHLGLCHYNYMTYDLKGTPSTFITIMDTVLQGLGKFAQVYMDDMLVFMNGTIDDHVYDLL